ncbi:MAG: hypothetical protein HY859_04775, partial [Caulobacterales bacterium]|nr:hypothetical protein [Caulobacterales bacterium]
MPLPNVNLTVQDPGLGLNPPSAEGVIAVIGQAASGTDAEVKTFTDPAQAAAVYVSGALLDRIRILFAEGAATVLGIKLAAGSAGSVGAATPDGGNTGNGDLAAAGTPTIGCSAKVKIVEAGRLGTATFKYSLDAGATWSAELAVPTTPGTYAIPNTGVTLTFSEGDPAADSFKAEDLWSFTVTGPASTNANLLAAIDALTASRRNFELILIAENCAAATLAALKVKAAALETARIYTRIVCEAAGPSQGQSIDDWISAALADVANFTDTRVGSCPARALAVVNGTETDINAAALIMGRIAAIPVQRSAGKVADGPLNSAVSLTPAGINDGQITDLDTGR